MKIPAVLQQQSELYKNNAQKHTDMTNVDVKKLLILTMNSGYYVIELEKTGKVCGTVR